MYIVSKKGYGVPKNSKDAFIMLEKNNILDKELSKKMQGMTGFRNIVIHQYQEIDLDIVKFIIKKGVDDFLQYNRKIIDLYN